MLTREQIEQVDVIVADAIANPRKIRDLAIAALDLRERAAWVAGDVVAFNNGERELRHWIVEAIRAIPLTPELPAEQVPDSASIGGTLPIVSSPARAGDPRCRAAISNYCIECGGSLPMDGSCWKGRTKA